MFDNFVLDWKDTNEHNQEEETSVDILPEPEAEVIEPLVNPEEEKQDTPVAKEEEELLLSEPEPIPLPKVDPIPEQPKEPTYSQAQYDAAIASAKESGYEDGFKNGYGEFEHQQTEQLQNLNNRLMALLSDVADFQKKLEQDNLHFVAEVIRKLIPSLSQKQAQEELELFLKKNFSSFKQEENLVFSFNPEDIKTAADILPKLANANDFEGKISLHKDASIARGDCKIEWKNGGVEKNTDKMLEKVSNMLEDKTQKQEERENGQ